MAATHCLRHRLVTLPNALRIRHIGQPEGYDKGWYKGTTVAANGVGAVRYGLGSSRVRGGVPQREAGIFIRWYTGSVATGCKQDSVGSQVIEPPAYQPRILGSRISRKASPSRLTASTVREMARPGNTTSHQRGL